MSRRLQAKDLGYTKSFLELQAPDGWDIVPVGEHMKRNDEFPGNETPIDWIKIPDRYFGMVIESQFRPVVRRQRWACGHLREARDTNKGHCPVCAIFNRHVNEWW